MSSASDVSGESEAVMAFIRERQGAIMSDAITALESSSMEDLPAVVHVIHGTLGSYQLHAAHQCIAALATSLADPHTSPETASLARDETVAALRSLVDAPTGDGLPA